jgi:hypothetical protein
MPMIDDAALVAQAAAEMAALDRTLTYVLRPIAALRLAAVMQLSLRHPGVEGENREATVAFIEHVRRYFAGAPSVLEILRRGDDPARDHEIVTLPPARPH